MKLSRQEALARLVVHDHGILCTVHATRGVDAVPVVYSVDQEGHVGVPVDRVKPKTSSRLQRERNLETDPRATLLIEHWDRDDWSHLWWVRAELQWQEDPAHEDVVTLATSLADRFSQYEAQPFVRVLVFRVAEITGWAAAES